MFWMGIVVGVLAMALVCWIVVTLCVTLGGHSRQQIRVQGYEEGFDKAIQLMLGEGRSIQAEARRVVSVEEASEGLRRTAAER